ncbi:MAG: type II secretion system protein [Patescibacteria group bacterium]|nr:type II secretion system protein [Patescibacteria group bacterium]MDD5715430.1 type II secretion system protein [Patescibacteria group bacterium]
MRRKGFTLIELLVVIAIIGILATIGLVALNGAREKARDATRKSDLSQVKTALVLYADDHQNAYPSDVTDDGDVSTVQDADGSIFNTDCTTDLAANPICSEYISKAVEDPVNDATNHYTYQTCGAVGEDWQDFVLTTPLEGGDGSTHFWIKSDGTSGDNSPDAGTCG